MLHVHYLSLWQKHRGQTCAVIVTSEYKTVRTLLQQFSPDTHTIFIINPIIRAYLFLFGKHITQVYLYFPLYAWLSFQRLDRHEILVQPAPARDQKAPYSRHLDPHFRSGFLPPVSAIDSYIKLRERSHMQYESFVDWIRLSKSHPASTFPNFIDQFSQLNARLGLTKPFVVLNLNCKWYLHPQQNSRRINNPDTYNNAIDYLIENGYEVVIQGRDEQHEFAARRSLISYFRMPERSLLNDFALYANCEWAITSRTGPELMPLFFDKPVLGLNHVECWHLVPHKRFRLFPKHLIDLKTEQPLSWKELLDHPSLYCFGSIPHDDSVKYQDLSRHEILESVKEFHKIVKDVSWDQLTPLQKNFRDCITPFHLDLFYTEAIPCDSYLSLKYHDKREHRYANSSQ
ncbi:MAG TPA: TIGR04372 family glycosyltransferase [Chlamydiales bacterium]|nr:TIGR04372 family glycosyltransferase [Chlamydiales bacterium]